MSIVSRLTAEVKNEIMSSAARAFLQDVSEMRRIDGTYGSPPENPTVGDVWAFSEYVQYKFDGERWILI